MIAHGALRMPRMHGSAACSMRTTPASTAGNGHARPCYSKAALAALLMTPEALCHQTAPQTGKSSVKPVRSYVCPVLHLSPHLKTASTHAPVNTPTQFHIQSDTPNACAAATRTWVSMVASIFFRKASSQAASTSLLPSSPSTRICSAHPHQLFLSLLVDRCHVPSHSGSCLACAAGELRYYMLHASKQKQRNDSCNTTAKGLGTPCLSVVLTERHRESLSIHCKEEQQAAARRSHAQSTD